MQYKELIQEISQSLGKMHKEIPATMQAFNNLAHAGKVKGALDPKTKELIALAIGISSRCDGCIGFHTKALIELGATREEILDMISVVTYMGGGPALMYAANALQAFEAFQK
jgi:AhpD family alkylhydroperoxidase